MKKLIVLVLAAIFALSVASHEASAQGWGPSGFGNSFGVNSSVNGLNKGYRGMVEFGNGFGWGDFNYVFKLSTTHGYQFNPYFYLGGFVSFGTIEDPNNWGYDYEYDYDLDFNFRWGADARAYLSKGRFAPFLGLQFGMDLYDFMPFVYLSGQVGFRVALKNKQALNLAVQIGPQNYFEEGEIIFKLGFEF